MEISRRGASANHGQSEIFLPDASFSWNEKQKTIEISKRSIKDFNTDSKHNYTVSLSVDEASKIINVLAAHIANHPDICSSMTPLIIKSLLKIQYAIVGADS